MPFVPRKEEPPAPVGPERDDVIMIPFDVQYPVIVQHFKPDGIVVQIVNGVALTNHKLNAATIRTVRELRKHRLEFVRKHKASKPETIKESEQWPQPQAQSAKTPEPSPSMEKTPEVLANLAAMEAEAIASLSKTSQS